MRRRGLGTTGVVAIVVVVVVVAGGAAVLFVPGLLGGTKSNSNSTTNSASGSQTTSSSGGPTATVVIPLGSGTDATLNFQPASLTVVIGVNNTFKWINQDTVQHNVKSTSVPSGAQSFVSPALNQSMTYTVTLTVPGTYKYFCEFHPTYMIAQIVVSQ